MDWRTTYDYPEDNPEGPLFLGKYAPGIADAHASVTLRTQGKGHHVKFQNSSSCSNSYSSNSSSSSSSGSSSSISSHYCS